MKGLKIALGSIAVLLLLAGVYYLHSKKVNDQANINVFQAIPETADAVFVINLEAFVKLAFSNISDLLKLSDKLEKGDRTESFQNEVQLSGINLSRKIIVFLEEETVSALIPIQSKSEFSAYLQKLTASSKLSSISETEFYSPDLKSYITFSDKICFITMSPSTNVSLAQEAWKGITAINGNPLDPALEELQNSDEHFSFYIKEDEISARNSFFKHSPSAISHLSFRDGEILLSGLIESNDDEATNPFSKLGESLPKSSIASIYVNLDTSPEMWDYWLQKSAAKILADDFTRSFTDSRELVNWDGLFNFSVNGTDNVDIESITYSYDDNFEPIEEKTLKAVTQLTYTGNLTLHTIPSNNLKLDKLLPSQSHYSQIIDSTLWFSTTENYPKETIANPNAIHAYLDFIELNSIADKLNIPSSFRGGGVLELIKEAELKVTTIGNQISTKLVIRTAEPEKNSLIYLTGQLSAMDFNPLKNP